jgi:hypothetical protein
VKDLIDIEKSYKDMLNDLLDVGKTKSLGYLPLSTLTKLCESSVSEMIDYANKNNLGWVLYEEGRCDVCSGALYLFHEKQLMNMLDCNRAVLDDAGVPNSNAIEYIHYISSDTVYSEKYPLAYEVVGRTFNDKRFK